MDQQLPPGLAGYVAATQGGQQQQLGNLQQAQMLMGLQGTMQAQQRDQAYRGEMAGLGPDATPDMQAQVAARYGTPDKVLDIQQRNADRKAQREQMAAQYQQTLEQRQQALDQKKAEADQKITDAQQRTQFDQWYKTESLKNKQAMDQLGIQLKQMGIELQGEKAKGAAAAGLQKQTQALGTALERANLPEAHATLSAVEDALTKNPKVAEYLSGPKSMLPDAVVDADVRSARQAFQKLFNITLKNRSGSAVTNQELERLKQEFATGAMKSPEQLKDAVSQARNIISKHYQSVAAGYGPDALNAYNDNLRATGGTALLEPGEQKAPAAPGAPKRIGSQGEYDALKSGDTYIAPDGSTRKKK